MDNMQLLYNLIELVVFFLPVGGLIWKAAKQAGRIEELEKDMDGLGRKVSEIGESNKRAIDEINRNLTSLSVSMSSINTSLEYIKKSIDEVRR